MTEQQLHEIAVAYAQIKLRAYQEEHKDVIDYNPLSCDSKAGYLICPSAFFDNSISSHLSFFIM